MLITFEIDETFLDEVKEPGQTREEYLVLLIKRAVFTKRFAELQKTLQDLLQNQTDALRRSLGL
jgi:hypothetical protein